MERHAAFLLHLEFSLKYNIDLQRSKAESMQKRCVVLLSKTSHLNRITPEFR